MSLAGRQSYTRQLGALGAAFTLLAAVATTGCGSDPCSTCDTDSSGGTSSGGTSSGGTAGSGTSNGGTSNGGTAGSGTARSGPCESDATCDTAHGFSCTAGECRYPCSTHFDCEGQGVCDAVTDNGTRLGTYCILFEEPSPAGQYYTHCPTYTECDADAGFECLGAGPGDADAYCSGPCGEDSDCPKGYYCDDVGSASSGKQLYCVRRRFCAPCETDADCLTMPGQVCARDQSGEKICTNLCDTSVDSCPWGNATVCGNWDDELGLATCAHRYGSCHGEGKGCEPCVRDDDCPTGFCNGSGYTGERWCVDSSVECNCDGLETKNHSCSAGNGCPRTPGGLEMSCYDNSDSQDGTVAHICFGANTSDPSSPQTGCWEAL